MITWQLHIALFSTALSAVSLLYLSFKLHDKNHPKTLSEIAITNRVSLWYFRIVLWISGLLFAASIYTALPRFDYGLFVFMAANFAIVGTMLLAVFPSREGWNLPIHNATAHVMAFGMAMLVLVFAIGGSGAYAYAEYIFFTLMLLCTFLAIRFRAYFIHFEILFVLIAHTAIVTALYFV